MPNEKDLQYFYNIYTKFKFRFKNWMYIIFLIRYDFKRKRHNLDRSLSKESRLEAGFHNIHTHKLNRSRQTRARKKTPPIIPIPFLPSEEQRSYRISPLAKANDIHFPVPFFLPRESLHKLFARTWKSNSRPDRP